MIKRKLSQIDKDESEIIAAFCAAHGCDEWALHSAGYHMRYSLMARESDRRQPVLVHTQLGRNKIFLGVFVHVQAAPVLALDPEKAKPLSDILNGLKARDDLLEGHWIAVRTNGRKSLKPIAACFATAATLGGMTKHNLQRILSLPYTIS